MTAPLLWISGWFSTAGITQEDIDVLRRLDCVEKIMPAYSADVLADNAYGQSVVRVHSMDFTNGINLPVLKKAAGPRARTNAWPIRARA